MIRFLTILVLSLALFLGALLVRDRLRAAPSSPHAATSTVKWPGPTSKPARSDAKSHLR